jgi:hypothetical protein
MRDGFKTRLETISGLRVHEYAKGAVNPPFAVVVPGAPGIDRHAIDFDATMGRGSDDYLFTIFLGVSNADDRTAHDALDEYLASAGGKSVKDAVEGNGGNLEGTCSFVRVRGVRNYGIIEYAGVTYLGAEFVCEVTA